MMNYLDPTKLKCETHNETLHIWHPDIKTFVGNSVSLSKKDTKTLLDTLVMWLNDHHRFSLIIHGNEYSLAVKSGYSVSIDIPPYVTLYWICPEFKTFEVALHEDTVKPLIYKLSEYLFKE